MKWWLLTNCMNVSFWWLIRYNKLYTEVTAGQAVTRPAVGSCRPLRSTLLYCGHLFPWQPVEGVAHDWWELLWSVLGDDNPFLESPLCVWDFLHRFDQTWCQLTATCSKWVFGCLFFCLYFFLFFFARVWLWMCHGPDGSKTGRKICR